MGMRQLKRVASAMALVAVAGGMGAVSVATPSAANPADLSTTTTVDSPSVVTTSGLLPTSSTSPVVVTVQSAQSCAGTVTLSVAKYNKGLNTYVPDVGRTQTVTRAATAGTTTHNFTVNWATMGNATWRFQASFTPTGACLFSASGSDYTSVYKMNTTLTRTGSSGNYTFTVTPSDVDTSKVPAPTGTINQQGNGDVVCTLSGAGTCTSPSSPNNYYYSGDTYYNRNPLN